MDTTMDIDLHPHNEQSSSALNIIQATSSYYDTIQSKPTFSKAVKVVNSNHGVKVKTNRVAKRQARLKACLKRYNVEDTSAATSQDIPITASSELGGASNTRSLKKRVRFEDGIVERQIKHRRPLPKDELINLLATPHKYLPTFQQGASRYQDRMTRVGKRHIFLAKVSLERAKGKVTDCEAAELIGTYLKAAREKREEKVDGLTVEMAGLMDECD